MPSISLMNFIERTLKDDNFFESAVENPLKILKENGVRLDVKSLLPKDLATFFGAIVGVKDLIKKKRINATPEEDL